MDLASEETVTVTDSGGGNTDRAYDETLRSYDASKPEETMLALHRIVEHAPNHANALNDLGVLYFYRGRADIALEYLLRAERLNPGDPAVLKNIVEAYLNTGNTEQARAVLQKYMDVVPADEEAEQQLIRIHARQITEDLRARFAIERAAAAQQSREEPQALPVRAAVVENHPKVHFIGPFFRDTGYDFYARNMLLALEQAGFDVSCHSLSYSQERLTELKSRPEEWAYWEARTGREPKGDICLILYPAMGLDGADIYAEQARTLTQFHTHVGMTMFETDRVPAHWVPTCNAMDEIWVPSTFNRETFSRSGIEESKLHVIPLGIDAERYNPRKVKPLPIPGKRGFTFLSVFEWNQRKGWDVLVKAYLSAFTAGDNVCLVIKTFLDRIKEPPVAVRLERYAAELGYDLKDSPPIILLDNYIATEDMPRLYRAADCFVLPTRGEGWGIPFMESMACGVPVVGTRWSSHLDFMNEANSYLIDIEGLVPVARSHSEENSHYTPDHHWAEPSCSHTAKLMRNIFENRAEAHSRGRKARQYLCQNWTLARTGEELAKRLKALKK